MKFSVIIPVYNVQGYLNQCVDSILQQSYEDFEVILVDDGSTDNSASTCRGFMLNDSRVKLIQKENGGSSTARNEGFNHANGDYVIFMDSDDYWCNKDLLFNLAKRIKEFKEDVVLFGCKIVHENGTEEITRGNYNVVLLNKHQKGLSLRYLVESGNIPGAAWIMTVKRELLRRINLNFECGVTAEDFKWVITVLSKCNAIGAIEGVHYAYIKRNGSVTSNAKLSGIIGSVQAIECYRTLVGEDEQVSNLYGFVRRIYLLALMSYSSLPTWDKKEARKLLSDYTCILKKSKNRCYYFIVRLLGCRISSWLIRKAYNTVR